MIRQEKKKGDTDMPTTYAHDRFGREVYEQLPVNLKKIIRENKKLYLIGLHGPDIFFYYHPFSKNRVSDYGTFLHEQTASVLFEDEVKKYQQSPSEAMEAYLLGFACHYLLDSTCHPYIGKFVDHTGISHAKIETSLDQYFMLEDGLNPLVYRPASPICPHTDGNKVIHRCFPEIGETEIVECLKGMKLWTRITICRSSAVRSLLLGAMKLVGCYDSMGGRVMPGRPQKECEAGTWNLVHLYERALAEAPQELVKLDEVLHGNGTLSPRFDHNFD